MTEYFDELETRDPERRQQELIKAVAMQVAHAKKNSPAYKKILAGVNPADLTTAAAIASLPLTRKSDLAAMQRSSPPFGGVDTGGELKYLFASPGPIYEPATHRKNYWRFARALFAAGFRRGDLAQNCFSYHLTPAGQMCDDGCHALGCAVIPAGTGNTEQQVQVMRDLKPDAYIGTPSFYKIIIEKADELGADVTSVKKALVSGEALPPPTRKFFNARGVTVKQAYATADLGLIAYESIADDGLIVDEQVYLEIVDADGAPLADGEVGEVVVTALNPDYPLLRFATGDLSAVVAGISACGRTNRRIRGWLGRADQVAKVRGMFVHPSQIAALLQRHREITRARMVIDWHHGRDRMTLKCETDPAAGDAVAGDAAALTTAIAATLRDLTKLRGEVQLVPPATLPDDGVTIQDARDYK